MGQSTSNPLARGGQAVVAKQHEGVAHGVGRGGAKFNVGRARPQRVGGTSEAKLQQATARARSDLDLALAAAWDGRGLRSRGGLARWVGGVGGGYRRLGEAREREGRWGLGGVGAICGEVCAV